MGRLLIDLPHTSDSNKYPKYFPHPLLLLKMKQPGDELMDCNLGRRQARLSSDQIKASLDALIRQIAADPRDVIVNCGHYAPDADKHVYFEHFIRHVTRPIAITGVYPAVMQERVQRLIEGTQHTIIPTDWDTAIDIPLDVLEAYPRVGGKLRASVRATVGCPRRCGMCPVWLIHRKSFTFHPIEQTVARIRRYYDQGVRYITFVDDNLTVSPKFDRLLEALRDTKLKGMEFLCQEGFEVTSFHRDSMCQLLKEVPFVDMYMAVENVNSDVLVQIDKYYRDFAVAEKALDNIKRHGLNVGIFFLLGLEKTEEDILRNIRLIADRALDVRVNIVRAYEGNVVEKSPVDKQRFRTYSSLAYAASWYARTLGVNIMADDAIEQLAGTGKYTIGLGSNGAEIGGRTDYWRMTSRFTRGLKWMFERHFGRKCNVRIEPERAIITVQQNVGFGF